MTNLTPEQRGEVYARVFHDLAALVPIVAGAPNILGPIYGARMCDRAIKVMRAADRLIIGLEDAMPHDLWKTVDRACHDHSYRASRPRDTLRARAGDQLISVDDIRYTVRGILMPPISPAEHGCLGADLKAVHGTLTHAECDIGNAGGKRRNDLLSRVRKATRCLLALRSHMDSAVQREHPNGIEGRRPETIYFGANATPPMTEAHPRLGAITPAELAAARDWLSDRPWCAAR